MKNMENIVDDGSIIFPGVKVWFSRSAAALEKHLRSMEEKGEETATVEAEYGDAVVRGSLDTLAHHTGEWANG